jgi:plasmid stability protein
VVTATAAVEGYAATRSRSEEAEARAWLVQALLAGGQAVDVPLARAQALAATTQTPQTRLRVALVAALVAGSRGDQGEARRALAGVVEEATELGFGVIALEARQAAARVEIAAGRASEGRDALAAVVADAERLGLRRIARESRAP